MQTLVVVGGFAGHGHGLHAAAQAAQRAQVLHAQGHVRRQLAAARQRPRLRVRVPALQVGPDARGLLRALRRGKVGKMRKVRILRPKGEVRHHPKARQQRSAAEGKVRRGAHRKERRQLQHQVRAREQRRLRARPLVQDRRLPALHEGTGHRADDEIRACKRRARSR